MTHITMIESEHKEDGKLPSVGEDFVEWAEKYWGLKQAYDKSETDSGEGCPYGYVRRTFAEHIDSEIRKRLMT